MTEVKAIRCPACGGPIQFNEGETLTNCHFCGVQVEKPQEPQVRNEPVVTFEIPVDMRTVKRNTGFGLVIAILIPFLIFGIVFAIIASVESQEAMRFEIKQEEILVSNQIFSISQVDYLLAEPDAIPEIAVVAYVSDSTYRRIYLDLQGDPIERWRSEPLDDEYYRAMSIHDAQNLYLVEKTSLFAISRADGSELWRVEISDEIRSSCPNCVRVMGDTIVVFPQDGVLAAYAKADGSKAWEVRLTETTDRLFELAGKPAAWDSEESSAAVLRLFDLATGAEALRIAPQGPNQPFPDDPQKPYIYSPLIVDPDGKSFYTAYGTFEPLTVQRWDAQSGEMVWQAEIETDYLRGSTNDPVLLNGRLYFTGRENILGLDAATGASRLYPAETDYQITPMAVVGAGDVLLVKASRTRGTARDELWAYPVQGGAAIWKIVPQAKEWLKDAQGWIDADGNWLVQPGQDQFRLVQFVNEPTGMVYQQVDARSGTAGEEQRIAVPGTDENSTSLYLNPVFWQGENQMWLASDRLYRIDLSSGVSTAIWP